MAAKATSATNVSACAFSSVTPASSRAFSSPRWAMTAQRHDCSEHAGELIIYLQRDGHHERRTVVRADGEGLAAEDNGLEADREPALQRFGDEGILIRTEVAGTRTFARFSDSGEIL